MLSGGDFGQMSFQDELNYIRCGIMRFDIFEQKEEYRLEQKVYNKKYRLT